MPAGAVDTGQRFDDPAEQARYERLIRDLRCLVCRSESIADSNAPLAADLRREVELLMRDGTERRRDPRVHDGALRRLRPAAAAGAPRTWLLWAAPALFLAGGLAVVIVVVRRRARGRAREPGVAGRRTGRPVTAFIAICAVFIAAAIGLVAWPLAAPRRRRGMARRAPASPPRPSPSALPVAAFLHLFLAQQLGLARARRAPRIAAAGPAARRGRAAAETGEPAG